MNVEAGGVPEPLTPPDCDLRGLPFMPLDVVRLLDSDFFALATGDEFKAALALWCKAWTQVPAGSLPDDDRILAHLSGTGHDAWRDLSRDMVLRGWMKCRDGRLYHPVVAEKALEALPRRRAFREGKAADTARKQRERDDRRALFEQLRAAGIHLNWNTKTSELRAQAAAIGGGETCHGQGVTGHDPVTPLVTTKTGTGTGTHNTPSGEVAARGGSRLPAEWALPREWRDWAAKDRNWREDRIGAEADKFRDFWLGKAGKDARKADWLATWRNWCRRADEPRGAGAGRSDEGWSIGGTRMSSPC